ncbi:MAG: class I SAM-dependent methyltransferase [Cellvibrionaceae bacterium]
MKLEKIKRYYDSYGEGYETERNNTYYYDFINRIEAQVVLKHSKNGRCLEVGCGTGIIMDLVKDHFDSHIGVDLSEGMIAVAKSKGHEVLNANVTNLPFENNQFDFVYSFKVLPHVYDIQRGLEEIKRVLADDGLAVLEFYNKSSFKGLVNSILNPNKQVFVRHEAVSEILMEVEEQFHIIETVGARIITPAAFFLKIPILNVVMRYMEVLLSKTFLKRFAGYYIVVLRAK